MSPLAQAVNALVKERARIAMINQNPNMTAERRRSHEAADIARVALETSDAS